MESIENKMALGESSEYDAMAHLRLLFKTTGELMAEKENRNLKIKLEKLEAENKKLLEAVKARDDEVLDLPSRSDEAGAFEKLMRCYRRVERKNLELEEQNQTLLWLNQEYQEKISFQKAVSKRNHLYFNLSEQGKMELVGELEEMKEEKEKLEAEGKKKEKEHIEEMEEERKGKEALALEVEEMKYLMIVNTEAVKDLEKNMLESEKVNEQNARTMEKMDTTIAVYAAEIGRLQKEYADMCQQWAQETAKLQKDAQNHRVERDSLKMQLDRTTKYWATTLNHERARHEHETAAVTRKFEELYSNGDKHLFREMMKKIKQTY